MSIRINVSQLLKEPVGALRQYDVDDVNAEGRPVKGQVQLVRTNRSILVKGKIETITRSECSRCLEQFDNRLDLEFEEEYFPSHDVLTGLPVELPSDQADAFVIGEDHVLDLTEAVRQYTELAVPMKPVCRENCAGLCPTCGRNLNLGPCGCAAVPAESPWAPLKGLLKDMKKTPRTRKRLISHGTTTQKKIS